MAVSPERLAALIGKGTQHVQRILHLGYADAEEVLACLRELQTRQWQPIETAPKDGTQVWAWDDARGANPAMWVAGDWVITYDDAVIQPTRWMPLPHPPLVGETEA